MRPSFSLVIMLLSILLSPSSSVALIKCNDIDGPMKPCIDWMTTGYMRTGVPPEACCNELFKLVSMGRNTGEKKAICECVKSEMQDLNINDIVAQSLPGRCQVKLSFPVTPKVDCSKI
ncbi:non-specific lipid-transfer protein 1-like [Lycium ferocissimum]|uniref:non-specific lipid-transfer protein 1-like n=1 Tax=Lycium ferocissimum TaxID=112874 RepID=UPI002815FBE6|nr:non-specific lipid-transfer protein 1-like [Lycium ferocissimum]